MSKINVIEYREKNLKILGISIWRIFAYFIIYSFIGYIIETIFGILTKGVWECRQSFLYGPFLGIYGVGAIIIILYSQYFKKNNFTLFLGGYIIGSVTEYLISFLTETILHTHWWDYSNNILNVNGRICLLYSIFWGILTVFLIKRFHPFIDKLINIVNNKISKKLLKKLLLITTIFLIVDCILTCYAQQTFIDRIIIQNNIEVINQEKVTERYNNTYDNEILSKIIYTFWNDEKMIKTFPNIKIEDINNNIIYLDSLVEYVQPYYLKIFDK